MPRWTMKAARDARNKTICQYYTSGMSTRKIAPLFGLSPSFVWRVIAAAGIARPAHFAGHGADHPHWKGGRHMTRKTGGYVRVLCHGHPRANSDGYVLEHLIAAEGKAQRPLAEGEEVHHIDRNKENNDPANLLVLLKPAHIILHVNEGDVHPRVAAIIQGRLFRDNAEEGAWAREAEEREAMHNEQEAHGEEEDGCPF